MAAGLGFKTFTTGEVLTAADVNGYLMQGILVFATEAARNSAITSPQEGQFAFTKDNNSLWYYTGSAWVASGATGDIEGVTAGVGISGGGTSGTVTITNSMATEIDAKGDLVVGTGADTFARLPVGTNGYTLVADSSVSPTGLKWAAPAGGGGITLISTTNYTGGSATLSITSIPTTYKKLYLMWYAWYPSSNAASIFLRVNSDTGSNYVSMSNTGNQSFTTSAGLNNWTVPSDSSNIAYRAAALIEIPDYTSTANGKIIQHTFTSIFDAATSNNSAFTNNTLYIGTSAITSIQLVTGSGTWSGGVAYLYGES